MKMLDFFGCSEKQKPITASRPIFQSASSFIRDDNEYSNDLQNHLKAQTQAQLPLPLYHQRAGLDMDKISPQPQLKPQSRLHLTLHALNTIFSFTSFALFITVIPIWNENFEHSQSIVAGDYTDGLVLAPLLISLFVSACLLIADHSPLRHHVRLRFSSCEKDDARMQTFKSSTRALVSATIVVTLASALTLSATNSLALTWQSPRRTGAGEVICNLSNIFAQQCQPTLYQIGGLQIGGIVTGVLAWLVWAALLAVSVRDWARERRERERLAKEHRRRRHERRRGHAHQHGHSRRNERDHPKARESGRSRDHQSTAHRDDKDTDTTRTAGADRGSGRSSRHPRHRHDQSSSIPARSGSRKHTDKTKLRPPNGETPAARLASHKVRPQETIQEWLTSRYLSH